MRRRVVLSLLALCLVVVGLTATGITPATLATLYLAAVTPWLVSIDVGEHRLPNVLVVPGIGVGLVGLSVQWLVSGRVPWVPLAAGLGYAAFLLVMHVVGGMGMGDVKLGAALGLGSWDVAVAVLSPVVAFFVGGVVSVALLIAGRRGQRIAFGPYLLGGYWAAVLLVALARVSH